MLLVGGISFIEQINYDKMQARCHPDVWCKIPALAPGVPMARVFAID